jgi:molecular chaperone GrpE
MHDTVDPVESTVEEGRLPDDAAAAASADGSADGASSGETPETPETPESELERWKELAARSQAELDNYRKRMARERTEAVQYANRGLLEQLLPILDNFEMGLKAAEQAEGSGGAASMILQGMGMVHKQIGDFLVDQGVQAVPSDGEAFDPNLHEAVKQEAHDSLPEGTVIATLRRGYRLRDRLLRAATVVVSSGPAAEEVCEG